MLSISLVVLALAAQVDGGAVVEAVDAGVVAPLVVADAGVVAPAQPQRMVRVTLKDGQVLTGKQVKKDASGGITLELGSGVRVELPRTAIESLEVDDRTYLTKFGETRFLDPNRTRYLYGPSAMMLKQNEVYFSQLELLASTVNWGVTDWLSVQAGAAVPLWFVSIPQGFHLLLAAKVGTEVAPKVHLAVGSQMLWLPAIPTAPVGVPLMGLAFATVTYGDPDAHVSLSVAEPLNLIGNRANFIGWLQNPIVTLSGNYRLTRGLALVTENWAFIPTSQPESFFAIDALAARVMGEHMAADLGLCLLWGRAGLLVNFPVPWIGFTYNFF